jgi:hypothetical protein
LQLPAAAAIGGVDADTGAGEVDVIARVRLLVDIAVGGGALNKITSFEVALYN